ncbi:MAG: hypothetical protein OEW64_06390 [Gammaproteobacteria bacterium]|nr:hypothetical protein [Gammaproteobacteria bacterium]MDH5303707.1 hypothetical protein [Gammaproteobacteria bacterium]MDH5322676.1 hypothetical protein [Gammaproteobacteria bacterium]
MIARIATARTLAFALLAVSIALMVPAQGQDHNAHGEHAVPLILGVLDFPTSGAPAAQDAFERGVKLLHSFEFTDARDAFIEAQAIDAGFVMAIWGEAMTHNHPLWEYQDRDAALAALAKLAPPGERRASEREQRYLDAVLVLFGEGDKQSRDVAYMNAMQKMHADYADDLEAAAFYALSILGSVYERDFRTYMRAAAVAEEVFARQPQHPGAAHYLIHSYDDQVHAPLGLRAAREYSKIAPSASHAQHMVSHIYTSLGMWDEVVVANANAVRVSEQSLLRTGRDPAGRSKHALHWLEYALLQQGRYAEARATLQMMRDDVLALPADFNRSHNAMMRASYAVDDALAEPVLARTDTAGLSLLDIATECFASAFQSAAASELDGLRAEIQLLGGEVAAAVVMSVAEGLHESANGVSADSYLLATIMLREMQALLAFREGDTEKALQILATAVADENSRAMYYGPPHAPKPPGELLGEMYLVLGQPEAAVAYFQGSLQRNTGRSLALLGLFRAQQASGNEAAAETWRQLASNWRGDLGAIQGLEYAWLTGHAAL